MFVDFCAQRGVQQFCKDWASPVLNFCGEQKHWEEARGTFAPPPNVLQNHFSNSANSGVNIVGEWGGVRPMILAIILYKCIGLYGMS